MANCLIREPAHRPKIAKFLASRPGFDLASLSRAATDASSPPEEVSFSCFVAAISALDAEARAGLFRADEAGSNGLLRVMASRLRVLAPTGTSSGTPLSAASLEPWANNAAASLALVVAAEPAVSQAEVEAVRRLDVVDGLARLLDGTWHPFYAGAATAVLVALCRTNEAVPGFYDPAASDALFSGSNPSVLGNLLLRSLEQPAGKLCGFSFPKLPEAVRQDGAPAVALYLGATSANSEAHRGACVDVLLRLVEGELASLPSDPPGRSPVAAAYRLEGQKAASRILVAVLEAGRRPSASPSASPASAASMMTSRRAQEGGSSAGSSVRASFDRGGGDEALPGNSVRGAAGGPAVAARLSALLRGGGGGGSDASASHTAPAVAPHAREQLASSRPDLAPAVVVGLTAALCDARPGDSLSRRSAQSPSAAASAAAPAASPPSPGNCRCSIVGARSCAALLALEKVASGRGVKQELVS